MKINLTLSKLEREILDILFYLTYKEKKITPIAEKYLRTELDRKNSLHRTLNKLIEKSYIMRTSIKKRYKYALSPNGKKILDLFKIIDDLDLEWTESEMLTQYLLSGYTLNQAKYEIKRWKEDRKYPTMCSQCYSVLWVEVGKIFNSNNLCIDCELKLKQKSKN